MMDLQNWARLPTGWIEEGGLKKLRWTPKNGSNNVAALMVLMVIAHRANDTGLAKVTYDDLITATGLSRSKVSSGLKRLKRFHITSDEEGRRSFIQLSDYDLSGGWAKLPSKRLYNDNGTVFLFRNFFLRNPTELHAIKLYYLFVSRRDRKTNMAHITYDQIEEMSGVDRAMIRSALSVLAANSMIHIEILKSDKSEYGIANAYRVANLDPYNHMGTRGRGDASELEERSADQAQ